MESFSRTPHCGTHPGRLVVVLPGANQKGANCFTALKRDLAYLLQTMAQENPLLQEAVNHVRRPCYYRTLEELKAPYEGANALPELELLTLQEIWKKDPHWESHFSPETSEQFLKTRVAFLQVHCCPIFYAALKSIFPLSIALK